MDFFLTLQTTCLSGSTRAGFVLAWETQVLVYFFASFEQAEISIRWVLWKKHAMEWEGLFFDAPNHVPVWFDPRWVRARLRNARRKNHLFYTAWSKIWPGRIFGLFFFTILSEGGEVLREGWDAVYQYWGRGGRWCYYLGRGEKGTITTRGGAGGGCNGKHFWLMELLLDRTNYFNRFFDRLCMCQKFCAGPRFFIFLSCECETVISTLDSNF